MVTDPLEISEEATERGLQGWQLGLSRTLALGLSLYSLYWVLFIVQPQIYRVSFLLVALVLVFLLFPARARRIGSRVGPLDWVFIAATLAALSWPIIDFKQFVYRAADPTAVDVVLGSLAILLVLEAVSYTHLTLPTTERV